MQPSGSRMQTRYKLLVGALWLLILYLMFPFLSPFASGPIVWVTGDRLDWASRRLAGWNAKNCGHVPADGDAREASNCVLSALRDKKPFRVRYDLMSVDADPAVSLVGAPDGHLYRLSFESTPFGGSSIFGSSVSTARCQEPVAFYPFRDMGKERGMISCSRSPN
jgi:hypothetical protein